MANRITTKMIEQWLEESTWAKAHGFHLSSHSGYHYIYNEVGGCIASGETTAKCWAAYCQYKQGYMLAMEDIKWNRETGVEL